MATIPQSDDRGPVVLQVLPALGTGGVETFSGEQHLGWFIPVPGGESASRGVLVMFMDASATVEPMRQPPDPAFASWIEALNRHLAGTQPKLDLPLDIRATAFQLRVWTYLASIPYGDVRTYAEVAAGIGQPAASRAVARACASNTLAVVIPCHRVIRGSGELAGYRWGIARKRTLLDRERSAASPR